MVNMMIVVGMNNTIERGAVSSHCVAIDNV